MRVRIVSILLLGLCILSVLIGLINSVKHVDAEKQVATESRATFFKEIAASGDKIALITLQGTIMYDSSSPFLENFYTADRVLKNFEKAFKDKSVKGVIFRINSPGGTVAMSQEIYNMVIKTRLIKPVVVSMVDVAASGGYYVACAGDRIYANPGTITGSIGVIMETVNAQDFLTGKLGIKSEVIKSGKFKDVGNIYRPLSTDEKNLLNDLINSAYKQFIGAVTEGRIKRKDTYKIEKKVLTDENLAKYADGRVFTGAQAYEYGFIDKLGTYQDAEISVKKMAREKFKIYGDIPVVDFGRPTGFSELFFNAISSILPKARSFESFIPVSVKHPRQPLFLWE